MPRIMKLLLLHSAIGYGIAAVFVAMLLWFDVARLGHLVTHTDVGAFAAVLLWLFSGSVFGAVQFGIAIMRLSDDAPRPGGGTRLPSPATPARVRVAQD